MVGIGCGDGVGIPMARGTVDGEERRGLWWGGIGYSEGLVFIIHTNSHTPKYKP